MVSNSWFGGRPSRSAYFQTCHTKLGSSFIFSSRPSWFHHKRGFFDNQRLYLDVANLKFNRRFL